MSTTFRRGFPPLDLRLGAAVTGLLILGGALATPGSPGMLPAAVEVEFAELHEMKVTDVPPGVTRTRDRVSPKKDSGGTMMVHLPGGHPLSGPGARPVTRMFRTGFGAGEPTLGVTKDGTILFQGLAGAPLVLRTKDGGMTWEDVSPRIQGSRRHPTTLDPYLYVDPDTDRVFTYDFFFGCSELSFSDDLGDSWTTTLLNCGLMDHQNLFAGPPVNSPTVGYPNMVYSCSTQGGATIYSVTTECLKSLDGGLSWVLTGSPPYVTGPQPENDLGIDGYCHGAIGHGYVGRDGTVFVPKGFCGQPWLAISRDEGATWQRVQVADNGVPQTTTGVYEHEAAVASDAKGNIYYFWVSGDRLPYLAVSTDEGETWSKPLMVGPPGIVESTLPKIDVGASGKIAVAYYGSSNSPGKPFPQSDDCRPDPVYCFRQLFFLNPPDPESYEKTTWNAYLTVTANALAKKPTFYSGAINDPADPFVRGTCGPIRCKAVYDFIDVVIDTKGIPWASLVDICISACATPEGTNNMGNEGVLGTIVGGPRLR
ncbi:MAG: sialidase family protein [Actinomycetota bacterium]